jgi:hypothetical protein
VLTNKKRPKIDGKSPFFSWKNGWILRNSMGHVRYFDITRG